VVTINDQTTNHNSFIQGLLTDVATQGSVIDSQGQRLETVELTKTDVPQVTNMIQSAVAPLATSADVTTLGDRVDDVEDFEDELRRDASPDCPLFCACRLLRSFFPDTIILPLFPSPPPLCPSNLSLPRWAWPSRISSSKCL
jgi:hypothetical protein